MCLVYYIDQDLLSEEQYKSTESLIKKWDSASANGNEAGQESQSSFSLKRKR